MCAAPRPEWARTRTGDLLLTVKSRTPLAGHANTNADIAAAARGALGGQ
jgi:hypothetical protein